MSDNTLLSNLSFEDVMEAVEKNPEIGRANQGVSTHANPMNISFTIENDYGKLSDGKYSPSFTMMTWGKYKRFDLRKWLDEDFTKPGKGITFTEEELELLKDVFDVSCFDEDYDVLRTYRSGKAKAVFYKNLGVLQEQVQRDGKIWRKEVNLLDWGTGARIDIRKWNDDYTKCSKGIALQKKETVRLLEILKSI